MPSDILSFCLDLNFRHDHGRHGPGPTGSGKAGGCLIQHREPKYGDGFGSCITGSCAGKRTILDILQEGNLRRALHAAAVRLVFRELARFAKQYPGRILAIGCRRL
ncbi:hypothetical protein [Bradyrhizobium sp. CB3481]|uniref:hypothetical protein n=1 Tax=Bradyrhizobium sp. CB3481 TaxID=3039158 RepID=UPI0024B26F78|nr:hypothetical protein [Bradyrhizobium sp. CB3481]WFU20787.1 hypothetical protein QA643_28620 [Bradyrhizobium sp. CB3481]